MTKFDAIKQMDIEDFASWLRKECLWSHFQGVVLNTDEIKKWLETEVTNEIDF